MMPNAAMGSALLAASFILAGCASAPARPGSGRELSLGEVIDSVTSTAPLDRTHWGIAVYDPDGREWRVRVNADRHFVPASNTKLVVATAALALLGPEYRYRTAVYAAGRDADSVRGLLVVGSGDPTWSARFHESAFTVVDSLAAVVVDAGIRRITGGIVIDATRFADEPVHGTWEVGDLPSNFAPPIDAFAIGEGTFGVVITPGARPGDRAAVTTLGPAGLQPLVASILTDTARARERRVADYLDRTDAVHLTGTIAAGRPDTLHFAVTDPAAYAGRALEHALRLRGIEVQGGTRVVRDTVDAVIMAAALQDDGSAIASVVSPPLREIVAGILQPSQNWIAEQLLKSLAAERTGRGSWDAGIEEESRWLIEQAGVDSTAFFLRDASGLSAQNLLAPAAIVRILDHARGQPWAADLRAALPAPGMKEGTLENRLAGYENRVRAKTGSITNVNSLSGYLTGNRELIFSIMTNGSGVSAAAVRRGIDRIVQALAREGGTP
jgi:D-alanyl-D-alanine carboxypeptidase/D-alanyl-D-alanine-endopeptidase (penicillin-binding protein 4)